jgi:type IV secretory pathway VirB2 component (pilin)
VRSSERFRARCRGRDGYALRIHQRRHKRSQARFGQPGRAVPISAAVTHKASQSGGIDKALLTLRNQPLGEFLVMLAALGLAVFGIYGLGEARWRKV